jgi:hypothetical protein
VFITHVDVIRCHSPRGAGDGNLIERDPVEQVLVTPPTPLSAGAVSGLSTQALSASWGPGAFPDTAVGARACVIVLLQMGSTAFDLYIMPPSVGAVINTGCSPPNPSR